MSFPVAAQEVDLVSDQLYEQGCIGVNVEEKSLDTFVVPDPDDNNPEIYTIRAYFSEAESRESLTGKIVAQLPGLDPEQIRFARIVQEDWAEGWKQHFSAMRFGPRLVVKPTWEELNLQPEDVVVSLDPGMAFGTGSHETTRLCLQALADRFAADTAPDRVLDVGTGSGILAIAAAKLGASEVIGCEIDADACEVARANVSANQVASQVEVTDLLLEQIEGRFDLVIANIMAEENVRLAGQLVARMANNGLLILSGILREKERFVRDGFRTFGLQDPVVSYDGEWCCLCYERFAADD